MLVSRIFKEQLGKIGLMNIIASPEQISTVTSHNCKICNAHHTSLNSQ